ncbi:MAG: hypothetical protein EBS05_10880 [Proteobacteria bacterium]|nr:hypothetical protein [Pseudomonadota bacterium]
MQVVRKFCIANAFPARQLRKVNWHTRMREKCGKFQRDWLRLVGVNETRHDMLQSYEHEGYFDEMVERSDKARPHYRKFR